MELENNFKIIKENIKLMSESKNISQQLELYKANHSYIKTCKKILNQTIEIQDLEQKYKNYNLFQIKDEMEKINEKITENKNYTEMRQLYSTALFLKKKSKNIIKDIKMSVEYV